MNIQRIIIFLAQYFPTLKYKPLPRTTYLPSEQEYIETKLESQIDLLTKEYQSFMSHTLDYYDIVRFANINMIYQVYKDIKKTLKVNKKQYNYLILMALQAHVSEQLPTGTAFIYRDDTYQKEFKELINNLEAMNDSETQPLTKAMDQDLQKPWESLFKKQKYDKTIKLASVFSMYSITGYYVKNTIQFLSSVLRIVKKSKGVSQEILNITKYQKVLFGVIEITMDRMALSKRIMDSTIHDSDTISRTERVKWVGIAFFNWETRNVLIAPEMTRRPRSLTEFAKEQSDELSIRQHPKNLVQSIKHSKKAMKYSACSLKKDTYVKVSKKPSEVIGAIVAEGMLTNVSNLFSFLDVIPIASNINSLLTMIGNLTQATFSFFNISKRTIKIEDNIQCMVENTNDVKGVKQKLIYAFMNFIDIFLPFATAKRTYEVLFNLSSINSDHSKATMFIINKWSSISRKANHKQISINDLFSGTQREIEHKIIEMNLNYFDKSLLI